ncbi:heterogeneous nuclear ribonucleoprotein 1-like [Silene latifolia]|uniref:heterogeneous nuclear ribonucleoprotein 1-like n=1 Tax=Silene latifolia TaxID=37657 RepID=UPI003D776014
MEPGKLFVGGISWDTNEDRLREYFQTFGEVVEAVIMKDRATGRARGFGFVIYADPAVAERVVRQKHMIDGRTVEAKKAVPRDDQHMVSRNHGSPIASPVLPVRTKKIFVGGLASTVTEGDFKRYFDQFGIITDVVVMYDHNTQRPRGFGFITFDSEEAVDRALINNFHELHGKMVEVKRAVPKELSPGPIRSPLGGGTGGLSRVNSFLNGYVQGYSPSPIGGHGVKIDERHSPMSFARSGFPPFSPSGYGNALNYEPRMSPNFGEAANLFQKLNFEQGLSVLHGSNGNRQHNSSTEFDGISRGSGSNLGSSWSLWGNGSINDSTSSLGFRAGDIEADAFKHSEALWNSSPLSIQPNRRSSVGLNLNYGREEANLGSAVGLYDRDLGTRVPTPSFASLDGIYDAKFDGFSAGGSEPWPLSSLGLNGSGSFEAGLGNAVSDVPLNNPAGLCW